MNSRFAYAIVNCPHCKRQAEIEIEVESHSDYYPQMECDECGGDLSNAPGFDEAVSEAVTDCMAAAADYIHDTYQDR